MLKRLFTSNTRIKLLTTFLLNPEEEYYIRELTRKLDEQINSIRRELDNLKKIGLLRTKTKSRKKFYYINPDFLLLDELTSMIVKVMSSEKKIAEDLKAMGDIKLLVLSGIFASSPMSQVDMLIVGEIDREKLTEYLNEQIKSSRPVRFSILTEEDYRYRIECKDKFITQIITDQKNYIPIKKI